MTINLWNYFTLYYKGLTFNTFNTYSILDQIFKAFTCMVVRGANSVRDWLLWETWVWLRVVTWGKVSTGWQAHCAAAAAAAAAAYISCTKNSNSAAAFSFLSAKSISLYFSLLASSRNLACFQQHMLLFDFICVIFFFWNQWCVLRCILAMFVISSVS